MARTYADLVAEVLTDEFGVQKYSALVKTWIGEGAQEVSREVRLPQLETTVPFVLSAGLQTYPIPSHVMVITALVDQDRNRRLDEVDISEIDESPDAVGIPTAFAVYGETVSVYPTPASTISMLLRYETGLADLTTTADSDPLDFPDDYLDLLVDYARAKAFSMEDDFEGSTFHMNRYQARLARMRAQMQLRSRGRNRQIQGNMREPNTVRFQRP